MLLSIQFHLPFHNMIMQNTAYKPKWFSFSLFLYFTQIITFILQFHNLFQDIKIMQSIEIKHYLCTGFVVIILLCFIFIQFSDGFSHETREQSRAAHNR